MPTEPIDSRVAGARMTKRLWIWGSIACALLTWLIFWWVSSHRISVTLPDGRVVSYDGVVKGESVTDTDFESETFSYRSDWITPLQWRIEQTIKLWSHGRLKYGNEYFYEPYPELLMLSISEPSSLDNNPVFFVLDDGFGGQLQWNNSEITQLPGVPMPVNSNPFPRRSPNLRIKIRSQSEEPLGELTVPNPLFNPCPLFASKPPPLEARTLKAVLRLLSADYTATEIVNDSASTLVTMEFDASACQGLLPCHVIGVRITDAWGNTGFTDECIIRDGTIIQAKWRMAGNQDTDIRKAAMQSPDWRIRIAICLGHDTSAKSSDIAIFEHITMPSVNSPPVKKVIRGRGISLFGTYKLGHPRSEKLNEYGIDWEVDRKGPLLWPILVKAIGHTTKGDVVEFYTSKHEQQLEHSNYRIKRRHSITLTLDETPQFREVLFNSSFMSSSDFSDFDLHVALEEPQVFEFFAKVSNWPKAPSKTQDSR